VRNRDEIYGVGGCRRKEDGGAQGWKRDGRLIIIIYYIRYGTQTLVCLINVSLVFPQNEAVMGDTMGLVTLFPIYNISFRASVFMTPKGPNTRHAMSCHVFRSPYSIIKATPKAVRSGPTNYNIIPSLGRYLRYSSLGGYSFLYSTLPSIHPSFLTGR